MKKFVNGLTGQTFCATIEQKIPKRRAHAPKEVLMKKQPEVKVKIKPLKEDDKKPAKPAPKPAEQPIEKPLEKPAPAKAAKPPKAAPKPAEKPAPERKPAAKGYSGKWVISPLNGGHLRGFFCLTIFKKKDFWP